jgi:2-hydroxycyclohexanecarboxyl-CoA dehydrogenase
LGTGRRYQENQGGMARLDGQTAIVTGAGSGIGLAIAHALAREGATVVVNDLVGERAETACRAIADAGGRAVAVAGDVADAEDAARLVAEAHRLRDRIDVLVNNAGMCSFRAFLEVGPDELAEMWRVHALGTFLVSQAAARHMVERRYGRIVSIVSGDGFGASPLTSHYQAAKAAQTSLTRSMALALGRHGVTANCVSPALVETPLWEGLDEDLRRELGRSTREEIAARLADVGSMPVGRTTTPEEVAELVLFLVLPATATVTGRVIGA